MIRRFLMKALQTTENTRSRAPWRTLMGLAAALAGIAALTGCTATVSPGYTYEPGYYDPYYYGPAYYGPDVFVYGGGPYYFDGHREYWHRGAENHHWGGHYGGHYAGHYGGHANTGGFHGSSRGSGHGGHR